MYDENRDPNLPDLRFDLPLLFADQRYSVQVFQASGEVHCPLCGSLVLGVIDVNRLDRQYTYIGRFCLNCFITRICVENSFLRWPAMNPQTPPPSP